MSAKHMSCVLAAMLIVADARSAVAEQRTDKGANR
jgi:hypothetical protein